MQRDGRTKWRIPYDMRKKRRRQQLICSYVSDAYLFTSISPAKRPQQHRMHILGAHKRMWNLIKRQIRWKEWQCTTERCNNTIYWQAQRPTNPLKICFILLIALMYFDFGRSVLICCHRSNIEFMWKFYCLLKKLGLFLSISRIWFRT